jgi:hypothetical protein
LAPAPPAPEPVRITIGRVELRTPPPPAKPEPSWKPPFVTLEEYLKR